MIEVLRDQLIGAPIALALSLLLAWGANLVLVNRAKRLWRLKEPKNNLSVVLSTSASVSTGAYERKMTGLGQARALGLLAPSLTRAYGELDTSSVNLSVYVKGADRERNLILLGGPKNNEVTRDVLALLEARLPITIRTDGDEVIWHGTPGGDMQALPPASIPAPSHGRSGYDYGYILRTANCFSEKTTVTVFAGTHTYGTTAAVRYFLDNRKLFRSLRDREYVLVVKALVSEDEHVGSPQPVLGPTEFS